MVKQQTEIAMANAELISKIKAEIKRRIRELDEQIVDIYDSKAVLRKDELQRLLSFISILESEKPMNLDELKVELDIWRHNHFHGARDGNFSGEYLERTSQLDLASHFYDLGQQSKPKVRFPHEKDIVDKVFGAGNLDGWEYDEAKALVALAKEELLKDIKPKASEELDEEIERYLHSLGVGYGGWIDGMDDDDLRGIARHFAQWGAEHLRE